MKAMIFAAGLGTRLRPLTDNMPKALVPFCGQPLIAHVIGRLESAGFRDFVVNAHHFAPMIADWAASYRKDGIRISISDETDMLRDTGGGIRHAAPLLLRDAGEDDFFLAHNVDIISDLDIGWFCSQLRGDALAVLLVSERVTSRYLLFDEGMRLVGWTNVDTGEVRSPYPGLDPASCRRYAFSGIHLISNRIFRIMDEMEASCGVMFGERFPIMDFYLAAAASYPVYGVPAAGLHLADVGKPETLSMAEKVMHQ